MKRFLFALWAPVLLAAGCSAANEGDESVGNQGDELRRPRGCLSDRDCRKSDYCATDVGACGGRGVCRARPQICTRIYSPVCGCDERTYGNACEAAAAGVSVASKGACPSVFCGGIAGIECPGAGHCVDDPSDDCDPANGGADCGGVCECIANALCVIGSHFDTSPKVCACVPDAGTNPCAAILCPTGTQCVVSGNTASCEPITDACSTVRCKAGTHCVANGGTATCEPDGPTSCGKVTCSAGTQCCNASCGWCRPPGVACIQIACE